MDMVRRKKLHSALHISLSLSVPSRLLTNQRGSRVFTWSCCIFESLEFSSADYESLANKWGRLNPIYRIPLSGEVLAFDSSSVLGFVLFKVGSGCEGAGGAKAIMLSPCRRLPAGRKIEKKQEPTLCPSKAFIGHEPSRKSLYCQSTV